MSFPLVSGNRRFELRNLFACKGGAKLPLFILLLFVVGSFAGCSSGSGSKVVCGSSHSLREIVSEYWELLASGKYEGAYRYECPVYRKVVPFGVYVSDMSASFAKVKSFRILKVERQGDSATVYVKLKVLFSPFGASKPLELYPVQKDRWLKLGGTWCHYPRNFKLVGGGA